MKKKISEGFTTQCFLPNPKWDVLLDAKDTKLEQEGVEIAIRLVDGTDLVMAPDGKVMGVHDGDYIAVGIQLAWQEGRLIPYPFVALMVIDSSGYDSHRYSVSCSVGIDEEIIITQKMPTAMMIEVFSSMQALEEHPLLGGKTHLYD